MAATHPEKILRETVDPSVGLRPFQATRLAFGLGFEGAQVRAAANLILKLYEAFVGADCSIAEINPLVTTKDGQVLALDAKINFDDNALFRHKEFEEMRDLDEEDDLEVEASKYDLNYIKVQMEISAVWSTAQGWLWVDGHHQAGWWRTGQLS